MNKEKTLNQKAARRQKRVRAKIEGTKERPRLCVSKSKRFLYLQIIDDTAGKTIVSAHSREIKENKKAKTDKAEAYSNEFALGKMIADKALAKKIKKVVFDRSGNRYHGRIKAAADGARNGGLEF